MQSSSAPEDMASATVRDETGAFVKLPFKYVHPCPDGVLPSQRAHGELEPLPSPALIDAAVIRPVFLAAPELGPCVSGLAARSADPTP